VPDLSLLEGAGILLSGMLAGRFWPARRRHPKPAPAPKPVCGCGHHASYHKDGSGRCHQNEQYFNACRCQAYTGPTPLPEYYAPEIT
jgi:hypothetical protein